jgi:YD repeat-containing protein
MPCVRNLPPSGAVNPSSAAPGNAYGHCKDNGNGHPNQQPAGCTTDSLGFSHEYDEQGLITQRAVMSDEATTRTSYVHDDLGRLVRSVMGGSATIYGWDAASNLIGEAGTDDPSTSKTGDAYAIARTKTGARFPPHSSRMTRGRGLMQGLGRGATGPLPGAEREPA